MGVTLANQGIADVAQVTVNETDSSEVAETSDCGEGGNSAMLFDSNDIAIAFLVTRPDQLYAFQSRDNRG